MSMLHVLFLNKAMAMIIIMIIIMIIFIIAL